MRAKAQGTVQWRASRCGLGCRDLQSEQLVSAIRRSRAGSRRVRFGRGRHLRFGSVSGEFGRSTLDGGDMCLVGDGLGSAWRRSGRFRHLREPRRLRWRGDFGCRHRRRRSVHLLRDQRLTLGGQTLRGTSIRRGCQGNVRDHERKARSWLWFTRQSDRRTATRFSDLGRARSGFPRLKRAEDQRHGNAHDQARRNRREPGEAGGKGDHLRRFLPTARSRGREYRGALRRGERLGGFALQLATQQRGERLSFRALGGGRGIGANERLDLRALGGGQLVEFAENVGGEFRIVGIHSAERSGRSKSASGCSRSRARSFFRPAWRRKPTLVTLSCVTSAISR